MSIREARHPKAALPLLLLSIACACAVPSSAGSESAGLVGPSPIGLPSTAPAAHPCGGAVASDAARPPTPVLLLGKTSLPGTMGLAHRWVEAGEVATGEGVYPRPVDLPAPHLAAGAELRLVSPAEAELAAWRIVGLVSALWPGPSDKAVVLADSLGGDAGPTTAVCFPAPGPGDWMVQARLEYANGRGNASFFWHLRVA